MNEINQHQDTLMLLLFDENNSLMSINSFAAMMLFEKEKMQLHNLKPLTVSVLFFAL